MKLWVTGSVRSKTWRLPMEVSAAKRSQLPELFSVSIDIETAVASCSSFFPGRSATYLQKERRLPGSIRRPWRLETASPRGERGPDEVGIPRRSDKPP